LITSAEIVTSQSAAPRKAPLVIAFVARMLLFLSALFIVDNLVDLASYPFLLLFSGWIGIALAAIVTSSRLTTRGLLTVALLCFFISKLFLALFVRLPFPHSVSSLTPFVIAEHSELAVTILLLLFASSIGVFRHAAAITAELLLLLLGFVALLSAHRELRFDKPKWIASLAWDLHLEYLATFILIAGLFFGCIVSYIAALSVSLDRSAIVSATAQRTKRLQKPLRIVPTLVLVGLLWFIGDALYRSMQQSVGSRAANGVGQEQKEGLSPLDFNSAVGGTSQPAALVRLDGDYLQNPFGKKLYLRESALSQMGHNELVIAPPQFDQDVSKLPPGKRFERDEDTDLSGRMRLPQSIFLIGMTNSPFAIDYPISLSPLKNPREDRFKAAYRAISLAPTFSLNELLDRDVGDPRWSSDERLHYLIYHPDYRYTEFAKKITGGITNKVQQAFTIAEWLSKNAIYTLQPNHQVPEGGDPVEPFLFGDLRGYCVHFAHATVYLLRSLGIPSRVGTGYMTDLSQSKDGHILLRMSDRHAWAEVYISGAGWIPFDTQPEKVESHADSPVDGKALEELMGMIGPDEEVLPSSDIANELGFEPQQSRWHIPSPRHLGTFAGAVLGLFLLLKIYLRFSWVFHRSYTGRLRASFRAILSLLRDAGYERMIGETYAEYESRISSSIGVPCLLLRPALLTDIYGPRRSSVGSTREIDQWRAHDIEAIRRGLAKRQFRAIVSLSSTLAFLRGRLS
jgi:hypothetical protein